MKRHPAVTPSSYPQVQAPIVNNPAFWERLGLEPFGTDTLFFAFYYQQVPELTMLLTILCPFRKKIVLFSHVYLYQFLCRTHTNNIWLQRSSRSSLGDTTESIIHGFRGMKSPKLLQMIMSREHMCTSIFILQTMTCNMDGMLCKQLVIFYFQDNFRVQVIRCIADSTFYPQTFYNLA